MAGVLAVVEVMPPQYKHTLGGPSLKVDLHTGAIAEGVLTFFITVAVLWIIVRGPRSPVVKTWLLAVCTVALVVAGDGYTGPSMNPVNVSADSIFSLSPSLLFFFSSFPLPDSITYSKNFLFPLISKKHHQYSKLILYEGKRDLRYLSGFAKPL